jgi:hypothetical protein
MNGDVNADGVIDITDVLEILMFLAGLPHEIPEKNLESEEPDITDALEILMYLAGLENEIIEK